VRHAVPLKRPREFASKNCQQQRHAFRVDGEVSNWPYPYGTQPRIEADHELRADPDEIVLETPVCKRCSPEDLQANGSYTSRRWNEKRQAVICRSCGRSCYLPLGIWLPRDELASPHGRSRPRKSRPSAVCDCGIVNLKPRGWRAHGGGRQLAECADCGKRIVLDPGVIVPGARNTEQQFALPDAAEEGEALVKLFESGQCDVAEIRELIAVSESEKRCLEFLSSAGMLASSNVHKMLEFREKVLELFNDLAATKSLRGINPSTRNAFSWPEGTTSLPCYRE